MRDRVSSLMLCIIRLSGAMTRMRSLACAATTNVLLSVASAKVATSSSACSARARSTAACLLPSLS